MICKHILVIMFLKEPKLILLDKVNSSSIAVYQ